MELHPENLRPVRTREEAQKRGRAGGLKSGQVKRERKLISQIYADFLIKRFDVDIGGEKVNMSGQEMVKWGIVKILCRCDHSSVSLLKEIRKATEGSKFHVDHEAIPEESVKRAQNIWEKVQKNIERRSAIKHGDCDR